MSDLDALIAEMEAAELQALNVLLATGEDTAHLKALAAEFAVTHEPTDEESKVFARIYSAVTAPDVPPRAIRPQVEAVASLPAIAGSNETGLASGVGESIELNLGFETAWSNDEHAGKDADQICGRHFWRPYAADQSRRAWLNVADDAGEPMLWLLFFSAFLNRSESRLTRATAVIEPRYANERTAGFFNNVPFKAASVVVVLIGVEHEAFVQPVVLSNSNCEKVNFALKTMRDENFLRRGHIFVQQGATLPHPVLRAIQPNPAQVDEANSCQSTE